MIVAPCFSLGREAAPQQVGAAWAGTLGDWRQPPGGSAGCWSRAAPARAWHPSTSGSAAGACFALKVLLGTVTLPLVLPALGCSLTATAVAWIALPHAPTYSVHHYEPHASQIVWALIAGLLAGVVAIVWARLVGTRSLQHAFEARRHAPYRPGAPAFAAPGALSISYPQLLGNGKPVVQLTFDAELGGLLAILLALKPIVTAACLGSGGRRAGCSRRRSRSGADGGRRGRGVVAIVWRPARDATRSSAAAPCWPRRCREPAGSCWCSN